MSITLILVAVFLALITQIFACPANCNDCDSTSTVCYACGEGYQLNVNTKCVDANTVRNCALYGPNNQCFACEATYRISNGLCFKEYSACLEIDPSDGTSCLNCGFGTVLANKNCIGSINCGSSVTPCPACMQGFLSGPGTCIDNTGNCLSVEVNGVCMVCKEGFKLVGYVCLKMEPVYACTIYSSAGICLVCKSGYHLYEGDCLLPSEIQQIRLGLVKLSTLLAQRKKSKDIKATDFGSGFGSGFGDGTVFSGSSGFGEGFGTGQIPLPANCQKADPFNLINCLNCLKGFILNNGECFKPQEPSNPFCKTYNILTGVCVTCQPNYILQNSICTPPRKKRPSPPEPNCIKYNDSICSACANRYYLNLQGTCTIVNPLCKTFDPIDGGCLSCYPTYILFNKTCILSRESDPTCIKFTSSGLCTACATSYFYNHGKATCQPMNPLCKTVNPIDGSCTSCYPGYNLTNGTCIVAIKFCLQIDPIKNACLKCNNGYFLDGTICRQSNPLCRTADSKDNCLSCYDSYVIYGNTCLLDKNNCKIFQGGVCTSCKAGYYLDGNGICIRLDLICKTYTLDYKCNSCFPLYILENGKCLQRENKDINCNKARGKQCINCAVGYYIAQNNGLCTQLDPLCKINNMTTGGCLSCYENYYLEGQKCLQIPLEDCLTGQIFSVAAFMKMS